MHVAMLIDGERLHRETRMLHRLASALGDDGMTVTWITPLDADDVAAELPSGAGRDADSSDAPVSHTPREGGRLTYRSDILPWQRRARAGALANDLHPRPDLIYAVGDEAWKVAIELASVIDRPVVIDIWCADQIHHLPKPRASTHVALYLTPTKALGSAVSELYGADMVRVARFGVDCDAAYTASSATVDDPCRACGIVMIESGRDTAAYCDALEGVAQARSVCPDIRLFLELRGPRQHELWRAAREIGMLDWMSSFADAADCRHLLTQCDMLLMPDRLGQMRSIVLEFMGHEIPVIAAADPVMDMFAHESNALMASKSSPAEWRGHIVRVLTDQAKARSLGRSGRRLVERQHSTRSHAQAVQTAFEHVVGTKMRLYRAASA